MESIVEVGRSCLENEHELESRVAREAGHVIVAVMLLP